MAPADYDAQLEKLAIELAKISAQLRSPPNSGTFHRASTHGR